MSDIKQDHSIGEGTGGELVLYDPRMPALDMHAPHLAIKGVGPQVSAALGKLGLHTVGDLLRHIPRRWEDRTHFRRVTSAR